MGTATTLLLALGPTSVGAIQAPVRGGPKAARVTRHPPVLCGLRLEVEPRPSLRPVTHDRPHATLGSLVPLLCSRYADLRTAC